MQKLPYVVICTYAIENLFLCGQIPRVMDMQECFGRIHVIQHLFIIFLKNDRYHNFPTMQLLNFYKINSQSPSHSNFSNSVYPILLDLRFEVDSNLPVSLSTETHIRFDQFFMGACFLNAVHKLAEMHHSPENRIALLTNAIAIITLMFHQRLPAKTVRGFGLQALAVVVYIILILSVYIGH